MDRISDSGSDGCGSIPHGVTISLPFRKFIMKPNVSPLAKLFPIFMMICRKNL